MYFAPFLDAELIPLEEGVSTIWREGYSEGHQTENPFVDDLQVMELTIEDEIDPLTPTVIQQDSLRQLFVTDALITYSFISLTKIFSSFAIDKTFLFALIRFRRC